MPELSWNTDVFRDGRMSFRTGNGETGRKMASAWGSVSGDPALGVITRWPSMLNPLKLYKLSRRLKHDVIARKLIRSGPRRLMTAVALDRACK